MIIEKVYTTEITNLVDIIGNVVNEVRKEYDPVNSEIPYYEHGHPLEIINTLREKTDTDEYKLKKYPLIALFEDFETETGTGVFAYTAKLNVLFITDTAKEWKATQRYANSFNTILTPIYSLFIKHLKRQKGVHVQHRRIDNNTTYHLYWGATEGNKMNDHIDAIEIKNLDIKIYR